KLALVVVTHAREFTDCVADLLTEVGAGLLLVTAHQAIPIVVGQQRVGLFLRIVYHNLLAVGQVGDRTALFEEARDLVQVRLDRIAIRIADGAVAPVAAHRRANRGRLLRESLRRGRRGNFDLRLGTLGL